MASEGTVFIIDDDADIRYALNRLVSDVGRPCRDFASAESFLADYAESEPGCVVIDVRMPGMSGLDLQEELTRRGIRIPVIVITGYGDIPMAVEAMRRGAVDFIEKPFRSQPLLDSIQRALDQDAEYRREQAALSSMKDRLNLLTPREKQVLGLVVTGLTNKAIALKLGVSSQAIDARRSNAMNKLQVSSIPELVRLLLKAEQNGFLDLPQPEEETQTSADASVGS